MLITRRDLVIGAAGAAALASGTNAFGESGTPLDPDQMYADLVHYAGLGEHRTGTQVDRETADWIARRLASAGGAISRFAHPTRNFLLGGAELVVGGSGYAAFPLWRPSATPQPVEAPLCGADEPWAGRIPVFVLEGLRGYAAMRRLPARLIEGGAAGAIFVTRTPPGSYFVANSFTDCAIPILTVGSKDEAGLLLAAGQGVVARLSIAGAWRDDLVSEVITAEFGPADGKAMVVSTPLSAFTRAAGERGCGVAILLAFASALPVRLPGRRLVFLAETGHEIDSPALRAFTAAGRLPPTEVGLWLHLGANVATYAFGETAGGFGSLGVPARGVQLITSEADNLEPLGRAFSGSVYEPRLATAERRQAGDPLIDVRERAQARGTARFYMAEGYPVVALEGGSAHHHTPDDLPHVSSPALLGDLADRLARFIVARAE